MASIIMGVVLYALDTMLAGPLSSPGIRYIALAVTVTIASASYFASAHLLGGLPLGDIKGALRRKR